MPRRIGTAQRNRLFGLPCHQSDDIRSRWRLVDTPWVGAVTVHELVVPNFRRAVAKAARTSSMEVRRIDSIACRPIRGSSSPSLHSYGLAWDVFDTPPGRFPPAGVRGKPPTMDTAFLDAFADEGFYLGAWFSNTDWPHIEWANVPPVAGTDPAVQPTDPVEYDTPPSQRRGNRNSIVGGLQVYLNDVAVGNPRIDNRYDRDMARAVGAWKRAAIRAGHDLGPEPDVFGQRAWRHLLAGTFRRGDRNGVVRFYQRMLKGDGFRPGPIDGIYGSRTEAAAQRLEADAGRRIDGILDPGDQRALWASPGERDRRNPKAEAPDEPGPQPTPPGQEPSPPPDLIRQYRGAMAPWLILTRNAVETRSANAAQIAKAARSIRQRGR